MNPKLLFLFALGLALSSFHRPTVEKPTILEELFSIENMTLELPLDSIVARRNVQEQYTARLIYKTKDKVERSWDIELKTRGKYRKRVCSVPPLSMRFDKADLEAEGFKKRRKVKLVTPCLKNWESDEYILREYLAYKLYELISDKHLRTHLVKIKYKNTVTKKTMKRYAILIEDEDDMADRFDATLCEDCFNYDAEKINHQIAHNQDLFQFMIGNTDYSIRMVRNVKLLIPKDSSSQAFVVPYDFDFCGLVNAPYAVPNSDYNLSSCRERRFVGCDQKDEQLILAIAIFKSKKKEILKYVSKFSKLKRESRVDVLDYLKTFFDCIEKGEVLNYTPENMKASELETDKD